MNSRPTTPTRSVYLIDDESLWRAAVRLWLADQEGFLVVGDHGEARAAVAEVRSLCPDLILLDVNMPHTSGIDVLPLMRQAHAGARIIMVTNQVDAGIVRRALDHGAHGFVSKEGGFEELGAALARVLAGEVYLTPSAGVEPPQRA